MRIDPRERAGFVPAFFRGVQDTRWYRRFLTSLLPPLAGLERGARVLDFGAGPGRLIEEIRNTYPELECVAADCDRGMLEEAGRRFQPDSVRLELVPQTPPLPFGDASFDAVCAASVLHVISHSEPVVEDLFRILRPGGLLLAATPAHHLAGPVMSPDPRFHLWRAATGRAGRRWDSAGILKRACARHGALYERLPQPDRRVLLELCWV